MRTIFLLAALLLTLPARSGELLKDIPERAPEHTLIEISGEEGVSWAWIIKRLPDGFRPQVRMIDSGKTCIWTGPPGIYDIDVLALRDGVMLHEFVRFEIEPAEQPDPAPPPGPPPPPAPKDELVRNVLQWASKVGDAIGSQALALVYRQVAKSVEESSLDIDSAITVLRESSDIALKANPKANNWREFRLAVSNELSIRRQRSLLVSREQLSQFLISVAQGLELSADGSDAISYASVMKLLADVNHVIEHAKVEKR